MFNGFYSFFGRQNSNRISTFPKKFCFENFSLEFDPIFLEKNFQFLLYTNSDNRIKVINNHSYSIPNSYESLIHFQQVVKKQPWFYKVSYIFFDSPNSSIILSRDFFGQTPLYYSIYSNDAVVFGSNLPSILKNCTLTAPNSKMVLEFADWKQNGNINSKETFFENVFQVLQGETIKISHKGIETLPNQFELQNNFDYEDPKHVGQTIRHLLSDSLHHNLYDNQNLACHLSGGLDSSSLVVLIHDLFPENRLRTYYADTQTIWTDESHLANMVANKVGSKHAHVYHKTNLFEATYLHTKIFGRPIYMQNGASIHQAIIKKTIEDGCEKIVSGHAGDAIIGYGSEYLASLFNAGNWEKVRSTILSKDYKRHSHIIDSKNSPDNSRTIYALLAQSQKNLNYLETLLIVFKASYFFNIPLTYFIKSGIRKLKDYYTLPISIINKTTKKNTLPITTSKVNSIIMDDLEGVFDKLPIMINEEFYNLSYHYKTHHIFPFYSQSLWNYSRNVPAEIKFDKGRFRGHLRAAMQDILPEPVRTRTTKGNFGEYGRKSALELLKQSQDLLVANAPIWEYIEKTQFEKASKLLKTPKLEMYIYNICQFHVFKTIYLAIWLDTLSNN